jgi:hypothetical protein
MHILAGAPGVAKTTIAMKLGASVSSGGRLPDGSRAPQGNVIIWSSEDDAADTLVPRLEASGADLSRVYFAGAMRRGDEERPFDPAQDMSALKAAIEAAGGAALIVIDPIVSATSADSHKNSETRRGLQPLVDMANSLDAALLGITHFTKGSETRSPIDRVTGSVAFGALARIVMVAAAKSAEEGEPDTRVLMRVKSNIGPDKGGFEYSLQDVPMLEHPDITASVVSWGVSRDGNARDVLADIEDYNSGGKSSALEEAKSFILDLLADGHKPSKEVKAEATAATLGWRTVMTAKAELDVVSEKSPTAGTWSWSLPKDAKKPKNAKNPCQENLASLHPLGLSEAIYDDEGDEI